MLWRFAATGKSKEKEFGLKIAVNNNDSAYSHGNADVQPSKDHPWMLVLERDGYGNEFQTAETIPFIERVTYGRKSNNNYYC